MSAAATTAKGQGRGELRRLVCRFPVGLNLAGEVRGVSQTLGRNYLKRFSVSLLIESLRMYAVVIHLRKHHLYKTHSKASIILHRDLPE